MFILRIENVLLPYQIFFSSTSKKKPSDYFKSKTENKNQTDIT